MKFLILLVMLGGAFHFWNVHKEKNALSTATVSANGFIELPSISGFDKTSVIIIAAENCPHEAAQRADSLAENLRGQSLPIVRAHNADFEFTNSPSSAMLTQLDTVMRGELPVVFVNGKAKNNPTAEEVIAEYTSAYQ